MSAATINEIPISEGRFTFVAAGTWDANIKVTTIDASKVTGSVKILIEGTELRGTSTVSGSDPGGEVTLRVSGGAGGLQTLAPGIQYGNPVTVRTALQDALRVGGESLSSESTGIDDSLPQWTRVEGLVADALWRICERRGLAWRVLADGKVLVGKGAWAEQTFDSTLVVEESAANRTVTLAPDDLIAFPGFSYKGQRVTTVDYWIDGHELRCVLSMGTARGQAEELLGRIVASETAHLDYHGSYLAKAVGQNGDGSLELRPYDPKWPPMSRVRIKRGLPGFTDVQIKPGIDVVFTHENGHPDLPVVTGFSGDGGMLKTVWDCMDIRAGGDAATEVAMANLTKAVLDQIATVFSLHTHPVSGANTGTPTGAINVGEIKSTRFKAL